MRNVSFAIILIMLILGKNRVFAQVNKPNTVTQPGTYNSTFTYLNYPPSFNNLNLVNYTRNWRLRLPYKGVTNGFYDQSYSNPQTSSIITTKYFNGWAQTLQSNKRGASGSYKKDIVTAYDYRPSLTHNSYLPVPLDNQSTFKYNLFSLLSGYYTNNAEWSDESGYAFSKEKITAANGIVYKNTFSPGKSFVGGDVGTKTYTTYNESSENIRMWFLAGNGTPGTLASYAGSELIVTNTEGQHGSFVKEYKNKNNQLVCKKVKAGNDWLTSVYVYDYQSRLVWTITPKAYNTLGGNASIDSNARKNLCYHYVYDKYGNVIERKVPDRNGYEKTVYDKKFRPVLLQTPLLKVKDMWMFNIYDSRDRVVVSGLVRSIASRDDWQNWVNGSSNPPTFATNYLSNEILLNHLRDNRYYLDHNFDGYPDGLYGPPDAANGSPNTCEINQYYYYDNYEKHADLVGRNFDTRFTSKYSTSSFNVIPTPYLLTQGLLTGSRTRIVANGNTNNFANQWIASVFFYDNEGRPIQTQTKNPWTTNSNTWDISTTQYSFLGDVVNVFTDHNYPVVGAVKSQTTVQKIIEPVPGTRLVESVRQKLDNGTLRTLATYTYDSFGRARQKLIGTIEEQNYKYNIRGQLRSINKDYVASGATSNIMTFGCELSYDYGFVTPRFDGSIAGLIWRGSGTSNKRAYGYKYDDGGRMTGADFTENNYAPPPGLGVPTTPSWNKYANDYSVSGISYDANGNMEHLLQKGMWYNSASSNYQVVDMDRLAYTYNANSNMLERVEDTTTVDYHLHDFVNKNNGSTDYAYDADANLQADKNKGIDSIIYNYQDLPIRVVSDTNTIDNIYDAAGNLLQKTIKKGNIAPPLIYTYFGGFVYRNDSLEYVLHDEGRSRWVADSNLFKYDYFVKDHLGNVRSVITTDPVYVSGDPIAYSTGLELSTRARDKIAFENLDNVSVTKPNGSPTDIMAGELDGDIASKRVGAAIMLQVMAGDRFNASVYSYYEEEEEEDIYLTEEDMLGAALEAFTGGINPNVGEINTTQQYINGMLTTDNYAVFNAIKANATDPAYPRAYLNYMLFDDDLNLIEESSGAVQLTGTANDWTAHNIPDVPVKRNGFLLLFVGRDDPGINWFDEVHISHYKGRLLEEQHYYPHGLLVEAGGQNITPLKNKYLYQGKLMQDELGLELYDFHARQYDPQIGRFWSVDPANQFPSGYTGMGNDPANLIDPTGMVAVGGGGISNEGSNKHEREVDPHDGNGSLLGSVTYVKEAGENGNPDSWKAQQESTPAQGDDDRDSEDGGGNSNGNKPSAFVSPFMLDTDVGVPSTAQSKTPMTVSPQGQEFIKSFEKFAPEVYDANPGTGDWTIGYGHKLMPGEKFGRITVQEAERLFQSDLITRSTVYIDKYVKVPLTQNQFDALASYVFNGAKLYGTQLIKHLNNGNYMEAGKQIDIITGGGRVLQGLVERRASEQLIWNSGIYTMHK